MRTALIKDIEIPQNEFDEVIAQVKDIYQKNAGVDLEIDVLEWSIPNLPFVEYYGGNFGISFNYLDLVARMIEASYGKKYDQITICVSAQNWTPKTVWGWNISAGIRGYEVQQCRFDTASTRKPTRIANSVGVIYHEMMHSHDGFCYRMLGSVIERYPALKVTDFDEDVVHGRSEHWEYIRHKENTEALKIIKYALQASIKERKRQWNDGIGFVQAMKEKYREQVIKATEPFAKW